LKEANALKVAGVAFTLTEWEDRMPARLRADYLLLIYGLAAYADQKTSTDPKG